MSDQIEESAIGKTPPVVGIGASAGGLEALREMFSASEEGCGLAFVVVQHLDPTHESLMAQLIERYTSMSVSQVQGGEEIEPDNIYVIPPGHGLAIENNVLKLTEFIDPRGMRRPIDDFLESLADDRGARSACVILSGTGADGSRGMRAIMEHGGLCVVQEPSTASYDGMPTSAIKTGLADIVSAPHHIISHLRRFFDTSTLGEGQAEEALGSGDYIDALCEVVRDRLGHDFANYKRPTLVRRVARRMQVLGIDEGPEYLAFAQDDPEECNLLFRDLLINVTRFFRDPDQFDAVNRDVIEPLVQNARNGEEIRVWVAGCSSGEEAFTFAMYFSEAIRKFDIRPYVQIFATDIDEQMLAIGRGGTFPLAALSDIPPEFQERYVIASRDSFTLAPHVQDMVRFGTHSLIKDPPFSKIDLVSCRNLLIYLDEQIQNRVLPLFHFALRRDGHLFLGSSETIGRYDDLFEVVKQGARLYKRRSVKSRYTLQAPKGARRDNNQRRILKMAETQQPRENPTEIAALTRVAEQYAPVSILLDEQGNLLQRWGRVGRYLDFPDRLERYVHVPSLARPGLRDVVGALLREVRKTARRTIIRDVEVATEFGKITCSVIAEPVEDHATLLVIRETGPLEPFEGDDLTDLDQRDGQLKFLEEELQSARHRLSSTVEELETTNEELKSSNEEMMSMNEELQSTNEELTTVNDELKNKVDELTVANADLKNFFDSTELVVIVVDADLRLRSYTEAATELFDIEKSSLGRPLGELKTALKEQDYLRYVAAAARSERSGEYQAHTEDRNFITRIIPYRRLDGSVDGATLVFTDVTTGLKLESELKEEQERLNLALQVAGIGVWEYEPTSDVTTLDETERRLLDIAPDDKGDRMEPILAKLTDEDRDRVNSALRQAMDGQKDFNEVFRLYPAAGGVRWLHGMGRRVLNGGVRKFIGVTYDISAERELLAQRELLIKEMHHRVKNLFSVIGGLVSLSARDMDDVGEFAKVVRGRIQALDRSHALSSGLDVQSNLKLSDVIDAVLAPSTNGAKVSISGPPVTVANDQLTPLALILHEWATNSLKYGALGVSDGALTVTWTDTPDMIELHWEEHGSANAANTGAGFGTKLMEMTASQLFGKVTAEASETGYKRTLTFKAPPD